MWTETEPNIGLYVTSKHQADPADILRFRLNLFKLPKKYINGSQFVFFVFIALQLIVYFAYLYYSSFILSKIFVKQHFYHGVAIGQNIQQNMYSLDKVDLLSLQPKKDVYNPSEVPNAAEQWERTTKYGFKSEPHQVPSTGSSPCTPAQTESEPSHRQCDDSCLK